MEAKVTDILSIGNKLDLYKIQTGYKTQETEKIVYVSQILDVDAASVKIAMPIKGGRVIPLDVGDKYNLCFYSKKGIYQADGVIAERYREGQIFVLSVELRTNLSKVQRRQYYRYKCAMGMEFRIDANFEEKLTEEEIKVLAWFPGVMIDLSGGGMKFVSQNQLEINKCIQTRFSLEIAGEVYVFLIYSRVIASIVSQNNRSLHENRIEFIEMEEQNREKIIKFIFEEERKKRSLDRGGK